VFNATLQCRWGPAIKDNPEFNDKQIEVARLTKPNGAAYYPLRTQSVATTVITITTNCPSSVAEMSDVSFNLRTL